MTTLSRSVAGLRIIGEELLPDDITEMLGCTPTHGQVKGQVLVGGNNRDERIAKFGMWSLQASEKKPGDLNSQISEILDKLNPDLNVWGKLANKYRLDLFCGLFMDRSVEGINLSPASLSALGQRNIELDFDIYGQY